MNYNYHTHTTRCRHASGTERNYIETAIAAGITEIGFSEHVPLRFPDGRESGHRMLMADAEDYITTLRALREEYKGRANIRIGFEVEYYPLYFKDTLQYVKELGAEYLILGQHYIDNEKCYDHSTYTLSDNVADFIEYVNCVVAAMKTGVFTYVAHPDIINFGGDEAFYRAEMTRLCQVAKEYDTPLEINLHGIQHNRFYPSDRFFAIAGEMGVPVTFGMDVHDSASLLDKEQVQRAKEMVARNKLNYIGMPRLKPIK